MPVREDYSVKLHSSNILSHLDRNIIVQEQQLRASGRWVSETIATPVDFPPIRHRQLLHALPPLPDLSSPVRTAGGRDCWPRPRSVPCAPHPTTKADDTDKGSMRDSALTHEEPQLLQSNAHLTSLQSATRSLYHSTCDIRLPCSQSSLGAQAMVPSFGAGSLIQQADT